ncbi:MAG: PBP1A family penicillin-binding protein [Lachnospiraceae bacterium]|nr:PBP1A family penicillin-binding protein [Lachnospiraceae bacterium]
MNYGKKGVRAKQKALNSKSSKWGRKLAFSCVKIVLVGIIAVSIIGTSAGIGAFKGIIASAPDIDVSDVAPVGFSTFVYDNEGNQIDKLVATNSNRISVTMDKIPQDLADAFVAIEDERFYEHNGIDIKGIIRAGYTFIKSGFARAEGASTITQQLLKNTVFTNWVNEDGLIEKLQRKFQEQYLALEITKQLSKEEILLRYMNTINLGQNTLGVQAASLRYFNKDVSELTLSECAVIAAITQNPSKWNPISHPENNAERRARVLEKMLEQGYITQAEYDEAMADDVYSRIQEVNIAQVNNGVSSYFVDALTEEVYQDLIDEAGYSATQASAMLYSGGLRIESTLDPQIQAIADEVFSNPDNYPEAVRWYLSYELTVKTANGEYVNHSKEMLKAWFVENQNKKFDLLFDSMEEAYEAIEVYKAAVLSEDDEVIAENISLTPQPQVSLTIIDQSTGYVVAMIGGRGAKEGSRTLNRATDSARQPGSTFKVLAAYAPALDSAGMTLATVFNDAPFNYSNGTPINNWYDNPEYEGLSSIRKGIYHSMNIVTVKCLTQITPKLGFEYLEDFGFTTLNELEDCYQPMALGGVGGVTNIELCAAYATIANNGYYNEPKLYTRVLDSDGNVILDHSVPENKPVLKETTAFLLTDAMVDTVTIGTGTSVNFGGMAIAGKTGTTSDNKDVWFAGYTPYYTAVTWAGYDNNADLSSRNGETNLAKKLWRAVMAQIHEELPKQSFPIPSDIVQVSVCSQSGKLPIPGLCDMTGTTTIAPEYFAAGTEPTETCDVHALGQVCAYTLLPAQATCPFQLPGVVTLIPEEDVSLHAGSNTIIENPDGTVTTITPQTTNICPHNEIFMADPNNLNLIEQQRAELLQRGYNFYNTPDPNATPTPAPQW